MRIDWSSANRNRPPYDVCKIRSDGTASNWPSWYAEDEEQARNFVRHNRKATPKEYPLDALYVLIHHETRHVAARFTVRDALQERVS